MNILIIVISIVATLFSSVILAYISMATMIGPFIAPTIILIAGLILKLRSGHLQSETNKDLALIQTVGSVGGIVATAVGFTLPTLYFLDRGAFELMLASPLSFSITIGAICLASGSLGILLGRSFKKKLLVDEDLPFPVSHLIHKTITSQSQGKQAKQLLTGFSLSALICFLRDGFKLGAYFHIPRLIPSNQIFLFSSLLQNKFVIIIMPMLWAIGFIAGTAIAFPLLVGMLSKYLVLYPINHHSLYLPFKLFPVLDKYQFGMAFCSGLVVAQVLPGILKYPGIVWNSVKQYSGYSSVHRTTSLKSFLLKGISSPLKLFTNLEAVVALTMTIGLFTYFGFPLVSQLVILPLVIVSAYNITFIGGKIGLVQIGRFTTFVMVPTMLFFKLTPLQITVLCVFVSSAITCASDLLFDYKVGELCNVSVQKIYRYQWLGVIVTSLCLGFFLWLLFSNLQVGTAELFAQRGKSRALLIQSFGFNWTVLFLGFLYGLILRKLKINPSMVFGGVLMPNSLTIGLVIGALGTLLTSKTKELFPFFSGVFAAESIWMIISILASMV